jgi:hypothetical protein
MEDLPVTKLVLIPAVMLIASLNPVVAADDPRKEPAPPKPPTFKAPKGWEALERDKLGITAARFRSGEGEKEVVVTLTKLTGVGGGLVANVNRWRGQVGLEPLDENDALEELRPMKVDGLPGHILDVTGPKVEGKVTQRVVVVVVPKGEETWYVRMGGPAGPVAEQKAAFDEFVKSIRFEK